MERLATGLEIKALNDTADSYTVSGYASVFNNKDRGGDIMMPGAFKGLGSKEIPLLWGHASYEPPIGKVTVAREDSKGLYFEAEMPKGDKFVSERLAPQLKAGSITQNSIGFRTMSDKQVGDNRELHEVDLWEISLVTFAMNPSATVDGFKSYGFKEFDEFTEREREAFFREAGLSKAMAQHTVAALRDAKGADRRDADAKQITIPVDLATQIRKIAKEL